MGNEISESGWTMYLGQSVDSWSNKNSSEFDIHQRYREASEGYPEHCNPASSVTSNEESHSMASDASSGPQMLPLSLPVQDIEFEQERQGTGSYSSLSTRKRDVQTDKREDLECVGSSSSVDVNTGKNKLRKLYKNEDDNLLLEDTASSSVRHCPDTGPVESDVDIQEPKSFVIYWRRCKCSFLKSAIPLPGSQVTHFQHVSEHEV